VTQTVTSTLFVFWCRQGRPGGQRHQPAPAELLQRAPRGRTRPHGCQQRHHHQVEQRRPRPHLLRFEVHLHAGIGRRPQTVPGVPEAVRQRHPARPDFQREGRIRG
jgi:hypothetical protein